jgi:hypothetical protein
MLHRLGYLIAHPHPAKALADALGHEADAGRAIRVERATYRAAASEPHARTEAERTASPTDGGVGSVAPVATEDDDGSVGPSAKAQDRRDSKHHAPSNSTADSEDSEDSHASEHTDDVRDIDGTGRGDGRGDDGALPDW